MTNFRQSLSDSIKSSLNEYKTATDYNANYPDWAEDLPDEFRSFKLSDVAKALGIELNTNMEELLDYDNFLCLQSGTKVVRIERDFVADRIREYIDSCIAPEIYNWSKFEPEIRLPEFTIERYPPHSDETRYWSEEHVEAVEYLRSANEGKIITVEDVIKVRLDSESEEYFDDAAEKFDSEYYDWMNEAPKWIQHLPASELFEELGREEAIPDFYKELKRDSILFCSRQSNCAIKISTVKQIIVEEVMIAMRDIVKDYFGFDSRNTITVPSIKLVRKETEG